MNISGISSSAIYNNPQIAEPKGEKPEGFQGSSKDVFVRDDKKDAEAEKAFSDAGKLFQAHKAKQPQGSEEIGFEEVSMYPNRNGYEEDFLGIDLPLPTLGDSIKDKAVELNGKPGETELTYTNFSVVMNGERRQCFFTACNIDGNQSKSEPRAGSWTIDGRIPRDAQLGNEAYKNNNIDKGHMVRRLDPAWGGSSKMASNDTFAYTNASMQHSNLNQKEWLELENHVLSSARGQKMTVLTGPVFSDKDPKFDNGGAIKPPTQIPEKFWKVVVWNDTKTNTLKGAAFVLSQEDILKKDGGLFKGGFEPGRFSTYQVPIDQLEGMTDIHFGDQIGDITSSACKLTAADNYRPQGLD